MVSILLQQLLSLLVVFTLPCCSRAQEKQALIYTDFVGNQLPVINQARDALEAKAQEGSWVLTHADTSDGSTYFDPQILPSYDVVVFLLSSGKLLNDSEKAALEAYIRGGGGFVGVHSAVDTEANQWPWYTKLVGASSIGSSNSIEATVRVEDHSHESTRHLPHRWAVEDMWMNYNFASNNVRQTLHVLATVDEKSYSGGGNGADHPVIWCHNYEGGRSWYTGLGYTSSTWSNENFVKHVMDGMDWAAGFGKGDAYAAHDVHFSRQTVYSAAQEPISGAVTPDPNDPRFFFVERETGKVLVYSPETGVTKLVQEVPVYSGFENGLLGIAFDPEYVSNQFVYLFYSPVNVTENRLSRFTMNGDTFEVGTEVVILSIPFQRDHCCHSGGHLQFGSDGNLWLSVGDNTNPYESDGFAPIDERSNRSAFDAQHTSSNTNDLRGKILRIKVNADGTYTCPPGNLFRQDKKRRCEIYTMGNRNPFRMAVNPFDPSTIYWGDVGPDSNAAGSRGPAGLDEVNKASSAGNYGWPYCIGDNKAYSYFDFAEGTNGRKFNCSRLQNLSPNNNGAKNIPPARESFVWYGKDGVISDPEAVPRGRRLCAFAPYMHKHEPNRFGSCALPEYYNNSLFFVEWVQNKLIQYILDSNGDLLHAIPLWRSFQWHKPIDIIKANDGSIYVVEFGSWNRGALEARISRMCYTAYTDTVPCLATASPATGASPLTVKFNAITEGVSGLGYEWDFNGDGNVDSTVKDTSFTYNAIGDHVAKLHVYDLASSSIGALCSARVSVFSADRPQITHVSPLQGGLMDWGAQYVHQITFNNFANSPVESDYECQGVVLESSLGHEDHQHTISKEIGTCTTPFSTLGVTGHNEDSDWLYWVLSGSYEDAAGFVTEETLQLHPRTRQVTKFSQSSNAKCEANDQLARFEPVKGCTELSSDVGGGMHFGWIDHNSWLKFNNYNPYNAKSVTFRVASGRKGGNVGTIEMRLNDPVTGRIVASAKVAGTRGWQNWVDVNATIQEPNQIFEVDLGTARTISAIVLDSTTNDGANDFPRGYIIYVSGSDRNFRPVHAALPNPNNDEVQRISLSSAESGVQHVRIMQTGKDSYWWWSIREIHVLDDNSRVLPIVTASASRESAKWSCFASNAIDGRLDTRWCTAEPQAGGPYDIYLVFKKGDTTVHDLFNLKWFRFND